MSSVQDGLDQDPLADYDPVGSAPDGESWEDASPADLPAARPAAQQPAPAQAAPTARSRRRPTTVRPTASAETPTGLQPIEASAERAVLAAILTSPETYDDLGEQLVAEDFGVPAHAAIYAAVLACDATGRPFDPITVADEMRREGTLGRAGGVEVLNEIVASEPELENLGAYVDIIIDRSLRRRMINASRVIGTAALDPEQDARSALDVAEHSVFELGQERSGGGVAPMTKVVAELHKEMAKARGAQIVGHSTGITELDEVTGGLRGGQFIIIAARPGMGKSVLATQIGRHISEVNDLVVPIFTYEMSQSEIGFRLLSATSDVDLQMLLRGRVPAGRDGDLAKAAEKLAQLRLLIDDKPPQTISGVRSACRRLARRGPLGAIVVDYLQLMRGEGRRRDETREQEVSSISRSLKLLASELDVPVIGVSQLSRGLENRPNRRPQLNDLRESGSLEQDANLVMFLYRDHVYDKSADETHAELILAKNRQGPQTTIPLDWISKCVRFDNTTRKLDNGFGAPPAGGGAPASGGGFGGGFGGPPAGGFGGGGRAVVRPDIF